ncbi:MAG TPA: LapA family protein [Candidatus Paceibacterota bacterium]|nr:LapA family protein [Candidatus Paceibacterota bacterium]
MTIISLLAGIILGAVAVIFILQNVAVVTVTFLGFQFAASLALVLLTTLLVGLITALLILVPSLMRDLMYLGQIKREKKALEDEVASLRKTVNAIPEAVASVTQQPL